MNHSPNNNLIKIKTALISVFDKTNIIPLAKFLEANGVKIISTGGSFKLLTQNNIKAIELSNFTEFPEMMDGRVKTLHPKIHGGLLGRDEDSEIMKQHNIEKIDLVIINLYPFEETVVSGGSYSEIIEKIDIGGPSMIRSSAKNYKYTTIITEISEYQNLQDQLTNNNMQTNLEFREMCASKAFALTGFYDSVISNWFQKNKFINNLTSIPLRKAQTLRYGENPHQQANFYEVPLSENSFALSKKLQGKELSYNNIADADAAAEAAFSFQAPCVCIVKHANPCGIATGKTIEEAYDSALSCDPKSAFGGIVALNLEVTKEVAEKLVSHFYEVIISPKFSEAARKVLAKKINLRLIECPIYRHNTNSTMLKNINGGLLIQNTDIANAEFNVTAGNLEDIKQEELEFSFKAVKFFKSNAIVITHKTKVVSFGCGQTSRVDAMEIACKKLLKSEINPAECILSSDAFFPFTDNLELAKKYGIKTIIAPKGSIRDNEIKEYANKNNINLVFTSSRHFKH